RRGPSRVVVCIGGSATTDGGAGMAQALGIRFLDASGMDLSPGGAALLELDRIDTTGLLPEVRACGFLVACDVDNPLVGPRGVAGAGLVVTGEGKLDEQSFHGKTVAGVRRVAGEAGVPVLVVCGQATVRPSGVRVASLAEAFGLERAMQDTTAALQELVEGIA